MHDSIAMLGLGRMGGNMVQRLLGAGIDCVVYDRDEMAREALREAGARPAADLSEVARLLAPPRAVWLMLPAGEVTRETISQLSLILEPGDVVVDGGNSHWQEDWSRREMLGARGIDYLDVGVSGGVLGLDRGYCLMVGGSKQAAVSMTRVFEALAPGQGETPRAGPKSDAASTAEMGYLHCGGAGAGHFVKMVHNAIEYGMMQAYAEGFELMHARGDSSLPEERRLELDVGEIAELWRRGSVIPSWLLDLAAEALADDGELRDFSHKVADSGEGRWAMQAALESATPTPALAAAMYARFASQRASSMANRVLSALRAGFGGH
ncbi:MAG: decarboxylating 6-phosphogluconate dehydrogenase [Gammaproteobacteria bacterium]|nr:decarboxylating 6-phosphogluconate dehydrogenase [Gammaproteobacteria bacterium]